MEVIKANPKPVRLFFFWSGIIATFAYRVIIILNFYNPVWVQISWYIGTVGFIIYFWHRYNIQKKRAELVRDNKLVEILEEVDCVDEKQKAVLKYIVKTTLTSKARWNSLFICLLSVLALVIGVIMDLT